MTIDGLVDTATAARVLGVTTRRVNQLADAGKITRAARGLFDRVSLEQHLGVRRQPARRAWTPPTAWAAVAVLSGMRQVDWVGERTAYRIREQLRTMDADSLVSRARGRADVRVFSAHHSVVRSLTEHAVTGDWAALGLADTSGAHLDGYVAASDLPGLVDRFGLTSSPSGTITLRATEVELGLVKQLIVVSDALIALDAAASLDIRARSAGEEKLHEEFARMERLR